VFYELHAKEGDLIALSQWEVTEPFWVRNLGYHPHALRQMGTQEQSISMRETLINPIPNETKENYRLRRQLTKAFAADVPVGKEYRYKQSIAINEWLPNEVSLSDERTDYPTDFPRTTKIAGTVYPALKMRGDADNLVLLPEFVERIG
jgi:hypothetical protein